MIQQGAHLPDVKLQDDTGNEVALASLSGKPFVLFFYPKDNTPGCSSEAAQFRDLYTQFQGKGVEIVGVSRDSVQSHQKFKEKFSLQYRLLSDTESKLCDAFGVIVEKNNYGKKSMGVQRSTFYIDASGVIAQVWPKVSVDGHAEGRARRSLVKEQRLELTILGSSCSIPRPGRACSSYLIEDDGRLILLDFGTGAFANLRTYAAPDSLDAIVISHMHTDHFLDLIPLRYALRYGVRTRSERIIVYLPPGGVQMLEQLGKSLSRESGDFFSMMCMTCVNSTLSRACRSVLRRSNLR